MRACLQKKTPFQDFEESFTADDFEKLDFIESQALSQQIPLANATNGRVPKSNKANGTMKLFTEESFGQMSSGYDSMPQNNSGPRSFSFKPLSSRSPNVPEKPNTSLPQKFQAKQPHPSAQLPQKVQGSKQTNTPQATVQNSNYTSTKIYVGMQSSPRNLKSSPPISSSPEQIPEVAGGSAHQQETHAHAAVQCECPPAQPGVAAFPGFWDLQRCRPPCHR